MKAIPKLLSVLLVAALIMGVYFLGTIHDVPVASALDACTLDSKGLAAALSSAVFTSNHTVGWPPDSAGEMVAEFYNNFMKNAK